MTDKPVKCETVVNDNLSIAHGLLTASYAILPAPYLFEVRITSRPGDAGRAERSSGRYSADWQPMRSKPVQMADGHHALGIAVWAHTPVTTRSKTRASRAHDAAK